MFFLFQYYYTDRLRNYENLTPDVEMTWNGMVSCMELHLLFFRKQANAISIADTEFRDSVYVPGMSS